MLVSRDDLRECVPEVTLSRRLENSVQLRGTLPEALLRLVSSSEPRHVFSEPGHHVCRNVMYHAEKCACCAPSRI